VDPAMGLHWNGVESRMNLSGHLSPIGCPPRSAWNTIQFLNYLHFGVLLDVLDIISHINHYKPMKNSFLHRCCGNFHQLLADGNFLTEVS
jgi:hypothetical protein